jgi:hypothetical protein
MTSSRQLEQICEKYLTARYEPTGMDVWLLEELELAVERKDFCAAANLLLVSSVRPLFKEHVHHERYLTQLRQVIAALMVHRGESDVHCLFNKMIKKAYDSARPPLERSAESDHYRRILAVPELVEVIDEYLLFLHNIGSGCKIKEITRQRRDVLADVWPDIERKYQPDNREITENIFWELIDAARVADDETNRLDFEDLEARLQSFRCDQIIEWSKLLSSKLKQANTSDIWGAGYLIDGGLGPECFGYFRAWLITQGKEFFERFIHSPYEQALLIDPNTDICGEDLLRVAEHACKALGSELPPNACPDLKPITPEWDEDQLIEQHPELWERLRVDKRC